MYAVPAATVTERDAFVRNHFFPIPTLLAHAPPHLIHLRHRRSATPSGAPDFWQTKEPVAGLKPSGLKPFFTNILPDTLAVGTFLLC